MLGALVLPVAATQATEPSASGNVPQPVPGGSHTMAIICLVVLVLGGVYLLLTFRRKR